MGGINWEYERRRGVGRGLAVGRVRFERGRVWDVGWC